MTDAIPEIEIAVETGTVPDRNRVVAIHLANERMPGHPSAKTVVSSAVFTEFATPLHVGPTRENAGGHHKILFACRNQKPNAIDISASSRKEITMLARFVLPAALAIGCAGLASAQDSSMSFFITSANPGNGADLGGLAGADAYCGELAASAGVTGKTWAAYLSTSAENARDRIGSGPWSNANGVIVADSVEQLHSESHNLGKETSLSEIGEVINGRGDTPNRHDILTGSGTDGIYVAGACGDWTKSGAGSAMVGHHDLTGGGDNPTSWNSAHGSRGCSLEDLRGTGGDGLFYCFATN